MRNKMKTLLALATVFFVSTYGIFQPVNSNGECQPGFKKEPIPLDPNGGYYCENCELGKFQPNVGTATACTNCPPGKYAEHVNPSSGNPNNPTSQELAWIAGNNTNCITCDDGSYSIEQQSVCQSCPTGFAAEGGDTECTQCQAGTFAADANNDPIDGGAVSCQFCPVGSFEAETATSVCNLCPQGRYADSTGFTECAICTAGNQATLNGVNTTLGADGCDPCAMGRFSGDVGHSADHGYAFCTACGTGEYQNQTGQTDCHECTPGRYGPSETNSECQLCPAGRFERSSRSSDCDPCVEGNHVNYTGATKCVTCERGRHQADEGQSECDLCAAGRHSTGTGNQDSECAPCVGGYAQPLQGQSECVACLPGTFSNGPESGTGSNGHHESGWAASECTDCPAGKHGRSHNEYFCTECKAGRAQGEAGKSECEICGTGKYSKGSAAKCKNCAFWEYATGHENTDCSSCFSADTGIGLAYPSQCISTWLILIMICILPCIIIYSYRCYMAGMCNNCPSTASKPTSTGTTTVIYRQEARTPIKKMNDLTNAEKGAL